MNGARNIKKPARFAIGLVIGGFAGVVLNKLVGPVPASGIIAGAFLLYFTFETGRKKRRPAT